MPYSQFNTIAKAKTTFNLHLVEHNFLVDVNPIEPSQVLQTLLEASVPLVSLQSEKARSEGIIYPILLEVRQILDRQITVFSGQEFNVNDAVGLSGVCDFILSQSDITFDVEAPVVVIVEAKKADIGSGLGQCAAEMVAAEQFNRANALSMPVYGCVTSGLLWRFMRLKSEDDANVLEVESIDRPLEPVSWLLGAIVSMFQKV